MSQPIPPSPYTHLCVVCHTKGQQREATVVNNRGHAVCAQHSEMSEAEILTAIAKRRR